MGKSSIIKDAIILFIITLIAGASLGYVNTITEGPIAKQEELAKTQAFQNVISDADTFQIVEGVSEDEGSIMIKELNDAKKGEDIIGYTFIVETKEGYGGPIKAAVGITNDGIVSGVDLLQLSETPGLGAKAAEEPFKGQFKDKKAEAFTVVKTGATNPQDIDAISGATITSKAVTKAVNKVVEYYNNNLAKEVN